MSAALQAAACPACGSADSAALLRIDAVPVLCNVQWSSAAEAVAAPRGDLDLRHCNACTHVFNAAFDPGLIGYAADYENALHYSPHFVAFADTLTARLVKRHRLSGARIVEIGCGSGEFLAALCAASGSDGDGFDRSLPADAQPGPHVRLHARDAGAADFAGCDLIVCRHVLEHMPQPRAFLDAVRAALPAGERPALYFEVPDVAATLDGLAIWDLIYEHVSYFSATSLNRLFHAAGFAAAPALSAYDGQFLGIDASAAGPDGPQASPGNGAARFPAGFAARYDAKLDAWRETLATAATAGERVVVWGAGSKGVTFLNVLGQSADGPVARVVDVNPRKHGRFVGGTGQEIVSPDALAESPPDAIIVMNPAYAGEIEQQVRKLGLGARLLVA